MLNTIVNRAVDNRLLVLLLLTGFIIVAAIIIPRLNLDAFPDVTNIQVVINTEAPGLAAEEVEQLITFPVESVMYALPDVQQVRSLSKTGLSSVTVVFKDHTDIYFARQRVFERLQQAKEMIPQGMGTPAIGPDTSGLGQVYSYLLLAEPDSGYDAMALRSLNDWLVKLLLMPVDGVTDVLSFGGQVRQYQVNVNPSRLLAYGLDFDDVREKIAANNRNAGGWYVDRGQEQLVVRGVGWIAAGQQGLNDIASIPLKAVDGVLVRVSDVASVQFGAQIRQGAVSMTRRLADSDGKHYEQLGEVVSGIVLKRTGANTNATINGINSRISLIEQALPDGVTFEPFYDQSDLIRQAVATVTHALLFAFVLIIIVIALFLLNLRATFLVLLSIPLSIALALLAMVYFDLSANLMSLGGLAVAIGMLVDGSVVMVDAIITHLTRQSEEHHPGNYHPDKQYYPDKKQYHPDKQQYHSDRQQHQFDKQQYHHIAVTDSSDAIFERRTITLSIRQAGKEVARPVFFAAMIILVVFVPVFSFEGVEARLFQPMAVSIMLAVLAAVMVALVVVPALAGFLFSFSSQKGIRQRQNALLIALEKQYRSALSKVLYRKKSLLSGALILLLSALAVIPFLGTEFVPPLEEGTINLRVTLAPSASLTTSLQVAKKLEKALMRFPEVEYALSRVGRADIGGDPEPVNNIEIYIGLKPIAQWVTARNKPDLQHAMEEVLAQHPGLLFNFSQPIATRVDELLSGVKAQLAIKLFGPQLSVLQHKGKVIETLVKNIPGAVDVAMEPLAGEAQLVVRPERKQLSRYGISVGELMQWVEQGIGGIAVGQVIQGNERYDIYLRLQQKNRQSLSAISNIRLQGANGAWLRLGDVATVVIESGPPQIRRDDVQRRVVIQANVQGRDMGSVVADIRAAIEARASLAAGYSVDIAGQFESQQRAQQRLMIVVPACIVLIALLLYFAFGSVGQAILIMVNVPLALIGGVFSLYLGDQYLSVPGAVGFITLFGVAVLNGVVMVQSINQRLETGALLHNAVLDGAVSRLRPVLMTALTSALGLLPVLLSQGVGAEIQKPLATVIVGGLISATALTLFVLPVLYPLFSREKIAQSGS